MVPGGVVGLALVVGISSSIVLDYRYPPFVQINILIASLKITSHFLDYI